MLDEHSLCIAQGDQLTVQVLDKRNEYLLKGGHLQMQTCAVTKVALVDLETLTGGK